MTFRFLTPALNELTEAAGYYHAKAPGLGADFLDEIDQALELMLAFPEAWDKLSKEFRHFNLRRFPYSLIYSLNKGDELVIASVFHQSRDPSSWRDNP